LQDSHQIRSELDELNRLSTAALSAVTALARRRQQWDEYLLLHQLRVVEGALSREELSGVLCDLEDVVARHRADDQQIYQQLDGRRQALLGHAELRLSNRFEQQLARTTIGKSKRSSKSSERGWA
jgi:hypothetical protein